MAKMNKRMARKWRKLVNKVRRYGKGPRKLPLAVHSTARRYFHR